MTIDLDPGEVSRLEAESAAAAAETDAAAGPADGVPAGEAAAAASADAAAVSDDAPGARHADHDSADDPYQFGRRDASVPPPQPEPSVRGRGMAQLVSAGVAGGMVTLVLAAGLQLAGFLPYSGGQDPAVPILEQEIAELRQIIASLPGAEAGGVLAARVEESERRIDALTDEVERQRSTIAELPDGTPAPQIDLSPIEARVAAVETAIAGLGETSPEAALDAVNAEIATIREELGVARTGQETLGQRLDTLEGTISSLNQRIEEAAEAPGTAIIIAASALKAAIDRGHSFTTELDTFAALAPDAPEIAELRGLAASGVATRAQITGESDAAAGAMINAARPIDPDAGIVDRLWASAMGLVEVRPIGMVEGDGVPEIVARLDAAVSAGDYERAIAEFETLPETARAAGEPFMAKVRARHAADRLIDQALAAALRA